jgi:hypothetical protein
MMVMLLLEHRWILPDVAPVVLPLQKAMIACGSQPSQPLDGPLSVYCKLPLLLLLLLLKLPALRELRCLVRPPHLDSCAVCCWPLHYGANVLYLALTWHWPCCWLVWQCLHGLLLHLHGLLRAAGAAAAAAPAPPAAQQAQQQDCTAGPRLLLLR